MRQARPHIRALAALALALAAALAGPAGAHQFHTGFTDISFNARSGSIEVVHTYHSDDIDALLANLYQRQFDLSQPEDEAMLRKYLEKQFQILGADGKRLPLRWVGLTAGPETVVVYQEIENTTLDKAASIHDEVLSDFLADQTNTVNVSENGAIHTLALSRQTPTRAMR